MIETEFFLQNSVSFRTNSPTIYGSYKCALRIAT